MNCELREAKPGFPEKGRILISFGDRLQSLKLRKGVRSSRWVLGKASGERGWGGALPTDTDAPKWSTRRRQHRGQRPPGAAGGTREKSHQRKSHRVGGGGLRVRWAGGTEGPRVGTGTESCAAMSTSPAPRPGADKLLHLPWLPGDAAASASRGESCVSRKGDQALPTYQPAGPVQCAGAASAKRGGAKV